MKWYLIELTRGDEYETELKASTRGEALAEARLIWSKLSDHDKKYTSDYYATYTTLTEDGIADLDAEQDHISFDDITREPKEMKQISIDNGATWCTPAEALEQMSIDAIAEYMFDDIREAVHRELAPCSDIEFLTRYLELADDDLIIG